MAKAATPPAPKKKKSGRWANMVYAYRVTKERDRWIGLILLGAFLLASAVAWALLSFIPPDWLTLDILTGVMFGLLITLIVFSRRAQKSQYAAMEGQVGAASAALGMLKRGWKTDAAVAFNRQQDVVHRVVGPPGIVLVGEGNPGRLKALLGAERTKHARVAAETPIHEVIVGRGPGEVPLPKLARYVSKMKRRIRPAEMTDVLARLKALDATRSSFPIPKGPVPTSMKGYRGNLRGR